MCAGSIAGWNWWLGDPLVSIFVLRYVIPQPYKAWGTIILIILGAPTVGVGSKNLSAAGRLFDPLHHEHCGDPDHQHTSRQQTGSIQMGPDKLQTHMYTYNHIYTSLYKCIMCIYVFMHHSPSRSREVGTWKQLALPDHHGASGRSMSSLEINLKFHEFRIR